MKQSITVAHCVAWGRERVGEREVLWLLQSLLKCSRSELYINNQKLVTELEWRTLRQWIRQREQGKPLAYVAGEAEFWGRRFVVNKNVLIPRPETETLVQLALERGDAWERKHRAAPQVVDIGTGSGVVAITIQLERPHWLVGASDVSASALAVARKNAQRLGAAAVEFARGDLWRVWRGKKVDPVLVVANLPYVDPSRESVAPEVARWEPKLALVPLAYSAARSRCLGTHGAERLLDQLGADVKANIHGVFLELSAGAAYQLERRLRRERARRVSGDGEQSSGAASIQRQADLLGRKRFLCLEGDCREFFRASLKVISGKKKKSRGR